MTDPAESHIRKAKEWARQKWGETFYGYPVEVAAYAHGLAQSDAEICNLTEALTAEGNARDEVLHQMGSLNEKTELLARSLQRLLDGAHNCYPDARDALKDTGYTLSETPHSEYSQLRDKAEVLELDREAARRERNEERVRADKAEAVLLGMNDSSANVADAFYNLSKERDALQRGLGQILRRLEDVDLGEGAELNMRDITRSVRSVLHTAAKGSLANGD